jgi:hypothetical protein
MHHGIFHMPIHICLPDQFTEQTKFGSCTKEVCHTVTVPAAFFRSIWSSWIRLSVYLIIVHVVIMFMGLNGVVIYHYIEPELKTCENHRNPQEENRDQRLMFLSYCC